MPTASLPGFTAEAAVGRSQILYRGLFMVLGDAKREEITPQFRMWWPNMPGCNPTCACITEEGCPCCIGPGPGGRFSRKAFASRSLF